MPQFARQLARGEMPQLARNQRASIARHAAYRSAACRSAASVVRGNDLWPVVVATCSFLWRAAKQGTRWLSQSIRSACRPLEQREWATALEPREGGEGEEDEHVSVEDAWEALELEKDASATEAQRAYQKACRRFHSCRNGSNPEAVRAYRRAGRAIEALRKAGKVGGLPGASTSAVEAELLEEEVMQRARPWEEDSPSAGRRGLAKPRGGRGGRDRQEPAVDPYAEFACGKGEVAASIRSGARRRLSALLLDTDVGADLGRGSTPLHFCAFFGRDAAAKMIVSRAGPLWWKLLHVANDDGLLPADVAARFQPGTEVASTFASWQRQADSLQDLWLSTGRTRVNRWSLLRIFRIVVVAALGWRLFPRCRQLIGLAGVAYPVYSAAVPKRLSAQFPTVFIAFAVLALLWYSPHVLHVWSLTPWTVVAIIQLICSCWVVPAQYRKVLAASGAMMMFEKSFVGCSTVASMFDVVGLEIALLYAGIDLMDSVMYQVIYYSGWASVIWLQLPVTIMSALALLHAAASSRFFVRTRACLCWAVDACCSVAQAVRSLASLELCWAGRLPSLLSGREAQRRKRIQAAERGLREEDKKALDSRMREAIAAADAEAGHGRRSKGDVEQSPGKRKPSDQDRRRADKQSQPHEAGEPHEPTSEPEAEPAEAPRPAAERGARAAPRKRGEEAAKQPSPRQPQPEPEERHARREEECRRRERAEEEKRIRRRTEAEERQRLEAERAAEKAKLQAEQQAKKAEAGKARAREEEKGFETETPQSACSSSPASERTGGASAAGSPQAGSFPRARARMDGQPLPPPIGARPSALPSKPPSTQSAELPPEPMRAPTPARGQGNARTPPGAPSGAPPGPPAQPAPAPPPAHQGVPPGAPSTGSARAPPSSAPAAAKPPAPAGPSGPQQAAPLRSSPAARGAPAAPPKAPTGAPMAPRWAARPGASPAAAAASGELPAKAAPRAPVVPPASDLPAKAAPAAPAVPPASDPPRSAPQDLAPLHLRPPPAPPPPAAKPSGPPGTLPPSPPALVSVAAEARPPPPATAAQLNPQPPAEASAPRCPWAAAATAALSSSPGGAAARTQLSAQLSACAPPQAPREPAGRAPQAPQVPGPPGPPGLSAHRAPPPQAARAQAPARTGRRVRCDGATDAEAHFVVQPYEADLNFGYLPLEGGQWLTVMYWQAGDEAEPDGWCYGGVLGRPDRVGWLPQRVLGDPTRAAGREI